MKKLATLASAAVLAAVAAQANAAVYDVSGSFNVPVLSWNIPFSVNSGTYDDVTGQGLWNITSQLEAGGIIGGGTITFDQTFTINAATGTGQFFAPTGCVGPLGSCAGLGANFVGTVVATPVPLGEGPQIWTVTTGFGSVVFRPELTMQPSEIPLPAAAWLFGSAVLGLAGVGRRRRA